MLKLGVDEVDCEYGVLADIGMTVFEAGSTRKDERLEEFRIFSDFCKIARKPRIYSLRRCWDAKCVSLAFS